MMPYSEQQNQIKKGQVLWEFVMGYQKDSSLLPALCSYFNKVFMTSAAFVMLLFLCGVADASNVQISTNQPSLFVLDAIRVIPT